MMHREQVLQQALALSPEDRAYVAAALEDSLSVAPAGPEAQEASSAALLAELQCRSAVYQAGVTHARDATEVLAQQRGRQAGKAKP